MGDSNSRRKLWQRRTENNLCVYCGEAPPQQNRKGCSSCLSAKSKSTCQFSKNNKEHMQQYRLLIKHEVIEKYGGNCSCCGEQQILFLTIDHKNNDGYRDRQIKSNSSISWYMSLRREDLRDDLQVLCFNCNLGKSINKGICPHQQINVKLSEKYDRRHDPQFDKRRKIVWPTDDELINMCNSSSVSETARQLKVHFTAVSNRLKRRNKYQFVQKRNDPK